MSEYNYSTEQRFWKRTQPRSLLVSCFLPFKAIRLLSKSRSPQHSSPGPSIWEMHAACPPESGDVGGLSGSGAQLGHAQHQRTVLSQLV